MPAWRDWLLGDRGRRPRMTTAAMAADVWERSGQRASATLPMIAAIEDTALKVYADNGLPTRHGHYRRAPGADEWAWVGETLPPEHRWAMVLDRPPELGWRYATLEDIGRFPGAPPELTAASALLGGCRHLKDRMAGREAGDPGEDLQTAIRLGADWRALQDNAVWRETTRLKLTTPSDALPPAEPEPEASSEPEARLELAVKPKSPRKPRKPRAPKA